MIVIPCPWCGPRDADEFRYVGEAGQERPDPNAATPHEWRSYLYLRANACCWVAEDWYHRAGCRRYISIERHTLSNETRPRPVDAVAAEPDRTAQGAV